jgi:Ca2+-binding EF-hand superfamily protein
MILLLACTGSPAFPDPAAELLAELDTDGSGALSLDELRSPRPQRVLQLLDTDRDGVISLEELRADLDTWPISTRAGAGYSGRSDGG